MALPFVIINLDKPRRLRYGMGAMIEYEQITGKKLEDETEDSFALTANVLWVMLKQDDEDLTLKDVCKLVDEYAESVEDVTAKVEEALKAATPKNKFPNAKAPTAKRK